MNKIIALSVIVLLVLSVVATGLAAVSDVNTGNAPTALAGGAATTESDDDNMAVQSFRWVCPFH